MHKRGIKLLRPIRDARTYESVLNHYQVEKDLAARLLGASRGERPRIYATMYDELFAKVPDHPRLTGRASQPAVDARNREKWELVSQWVTPGTTVVEFAPGDCAFASFLSGRVKQVYGVDISDQSESGAAAPSNFRMIIYDGYNLDLPDGTADMVFSDQLIEHLHPDDVVGHFRLARRLLKPCGVYVLRTPDALYGPWDISRYFSGTPQGLHLKEWTYADLDAVLTSAGFFFWIGHGYFKGRYRVLPRPYLLLAVRLMRPLHPPLRRLLCPAFLLPRHIYLIAGMQMR